MPTEVLACPSCRAPGPLGPDAHGEYRCIYCGTRFRQTPVAPAPTPVVHHGGSAQPARNNSGATAGVLIAGGLLILAGAGAAFFLLLAPGEVSVEQRASAPPARAEPAILPTLAPAPPQPISAPVPEIPAPELEPPASASFEFHRTQSAYKTSFYALGFVTNTSPFVIDKPKVIAVLLDAQGNELGTEFGYAERDVLAPDERSPIKILLSEPPEHASIRYEIVASKASYIPPQVEGLRLEPMPARPAQFGKDTWELEGKVHNEGTQSAKFVSVEIQALDVNGKLVGLGTTYADGDVLAPGGVARYSTQITLADKADHFEFVLGNRVAD
jgi:hypothetical protein